VTFYGLRRSELKNYSESVLATLSRVLAERNAARSEKSVALECRLVRIESNICAVLELTISRHNDS
jgi:hypothetical protein